MNTPLVDKIVNAVLYEGYILYPYRPSVKNRQRWTFGGLYPRAYSEAQAGSDPWRMNTECLVRGDALSTLRVKVRFLHLTDRLIGQFDPSLGDVAEAQSAPRRFVDSLQVGDRAYQAWQEAVERESVLAPWQLGDEICSRAFTWESSERREPIRDASASVVGMIVRRQRAIAAYVLISAQRVAGGLFKVRVQVQNRTAPANAASYSRDEAVLSSLASTHIVLEVQDGEFLSLIDPPAEAVELTASCQNVGAWPVLVGSPGQHDTMLAAPIILYDYPQIAPESPGDLFDGTEIDEILSLRILTLSDDEKRQAAGLDDRVRALLTRTSALDRTQFAGLHGVMHPVSPASKEMPA